MTHVSTDETTSCACETNVTEGCSCKGGGCCEMEDATECTSCATGPEAKKIPLSVVTKADIEVLEKRKTK